MEQKKKKRIRSLDVTLPTKCDICNDAIPLYSPWYSVMMTGHFCPDPTIGGNESKGYQALCPECFYAYKDFVIERKTEKNHRQHMQDVMNPT